jgi:hypothetical protein
VPGSHARLVLVQSLAPDELQRALLTLRDGGTPEQWLAAADVWRTFLDEHPAIRASVAAWVADELLSSYTPGPICPAGAGDRRARMETA